ncbi:scavenger receptor cysteine-rich type 1 protein M130 [Erpetoichthys calabaricus]|uniref:scavenger receptor cysteine-rich type 1 protein M130 n=1 Tax=Erpetoichthys calabaricus TaxID=27687 RepID=UPI0022344D1A|nr:scavenger receptor cysteine-rich type 1 protein M130 [Erpetoichthys calabaricus]
MLLFQLTFSMWLTNGPAVVDSQKQGPEKLRLKNSNNPCSGRLEVLYNGQWGLVFHSKWRQTNSEVVCRQLRCGSEVTTQFGLNFDSELPNKIFESDVFCNGDEESLSRCYKNNWEIKTNISIFNHVNIKCSEQVSLSLSGGDHPCEGRVEITYKEKKGIICDNNWGINEANIVCKELQCGTAAYAYKGGEYGKGPDKVWINTLNCSGNEDFIWHCGNKEQKICQSNDVSVVCNGMTKVMLDGDNTNCTGTLTVLEDGKWKPLSTAKYTFKDQSTNCSQKKCKVVSKNSSLESVSLTCSEKLKVSLWNERDTTKECYGTVYASTNHTTMPVCSNKWDELDAKVVCKELECGTVISFGLALREENGIRDYFRCTGNESGLWECGSQPAPKEPCRPATVVCKESVKLRFAKGDAWTCAGRIEVSVKGNWESVCNDKLNLIKLCKTLECGNEIKKKDVFGKGARTNQDICTFIPELCEKDPKMLYNSDEDIGIICQKHKRLQLSEGNSSCSGLVEIFQDDKWKRLKGDLWDLSAATAVCRQLQCGTALSIERKEENSTVPFWNETFRCTSNEKSLFDCQVIQNHLKQNMSASVTCSGTVSVRLDGTMSNCYGYVEVCFGSTCHPLCSDSWSKAESQVICRELKCGDPVEVNTYTETAQKGQSLKSVHCNGDERFFGHCLFMDNATKCQKNNKAYVVCTESVKPRLVDGEHRCSGRVELFYSGTWQSVCSKHFNTQFGNASCKQLRCGEYDQHFTYVTNKEKSALQIKDCAEDVKTLSDCLQMSQQSCGAPNLGLQCSENMDIILQDSSGNNPCSGRVMIRYQKRLKPVVSMGWTISEATVLCRQLHCGKLLDVKEETENFHNYKNWMEFQFKCNGNESSIWDCQTYTQNLIFNTPVYVTCTGREYFY